MNRELYDALRLAALAAWRVSGDPKYLTLASDRINQLKQHQALYRQSYWWRMRINMYWNVAAGVKRGHRYALYAVRTAR